MDGWTDRQTEERSNFIMHSTGLWLSLKIGLWYKGRERILWQWIIHVKDSDWNK
jgi:hypothetical protein